MERAKGDIDDAKQRFTMAAKRYERDGQKPADRQKYLRNCQKQAVTKQGRIGRELIKLEKELRELSEDDAEAAKEAEIAELDELSRDREIAELSCKIEREVALARGDAAGARTLAGPPRGLPDIASGAQLSDLVPTDSLEVIEPEPEPEPETRE